MVGKNYQAFAREGTLPAGGTRVLATSGAFDHCNMTAGPHIDAERAAAFRDILLAMSWDDAAVRPLLRSEEHTSELQSQSNLVCRLLLEKKKNSHAIRVAERAKPLSQRARDDQL